MTELLPIPVISVVGAGSNSGKTTLLEKIIREAKARGWRVATIKHDVHNFEMDQPGKDTWRFAQAGADIVAISSPQKFAFLENVTEDQPLDDLIARIKGVDVIFTEGYKTGNKPKIEVFRSGVHEKLFCRQEELIAVVTDAELDPGVPTFGLDDIAGICDLLQSLYALGQQSA